MPQQPDGQREDQPVPIDSGTWELIVVGSFPGRPA
jgi:hypothetical protein